MARAAARFGPVCALVVPACLTDFEQYRVQPTSADVPAAERLDDGAGKGSDGEGGARDGGTLDGRVDTCGASPNVVVRLAHMAVGYRPMDLCVRRGILGALARVPMASWPAPGVEYGQVSRAVTLGTASQREMWQLAVVAHGAPCDTRIAVMTMLEPGYRGTLVFTSAATPAGGVRGSLGLLTDEACSLCPADVGYYVRAIHAARGYSETRLDFIVSNRPPVVVAGDVAYGDAERTGQGYRCQIVFLVLPSPTFALRSTLSGVELLRAQPYTLNGVRIRPHRLATLFAMGVPGDELHPAGFTFCYDGVERAGLTVCDTVRSNITSDAGRDGPLEAGVDAAQDAVDDLARQDVPGQQDVGPFDGGAEDLPDATPDDLGDAGSHDAEPHDAGLDEEATKVGDVSFGDLSCGGSGG